MPTGFEQFEANLAFLCKAGVGIWFPVWAWRKRGELDVELTKPMQRFRAIAISACLVVASLPIREIGPLRGLSALLGVSYWVWPNLAFHSVKILRRNDLRYIVAALRRWNPLGFSGDPSDNQSELSVYDEYAPRVLAVLDHQDSVDQVEAELVAIRAVWTADRDPSRDRQVASDLVAWRRSRRRNAVAA